MSAIVLYSDPAVLMEKLPEKIPDPKLHYENTRGFEELVAYDLYRIWKDRRGLIRWALREWPDDGLPVANHGARRRLDRVIIDCYQHLRLRAALREST